MVSNKKAQGLPLNTVILAILVIVVLIIVIVFFLTGTGSVAQRVKDIFTGGTRGTDLSFATMQCERYCDDAREMSKDLQMNSAYCKSWFKLDVDPNDGSVDKFDKNDGDKANQPKHYYCGSQAYDATDDQFKSDEKTVGVECGGVLCASL